MSSSLNVEIPGEQGASPGGGEDLLSVAERALVEPEPEPEPEVGSADQQVLLPGEPQRAVDDAAEEVGRAEAAAQPRVKSEQSLFNTLSPRSEQMAHGDLTSSEALDVALSAEQAARTVHIGRIPDDLATKTKLMSLMRACGCPDPSNITFCIGSERTVKEKENKLCWALATFDTPALASEVLAATLDKTGKQLLRCTMVDRNLLAAKSGAALGKIASVHQLALGGSSYNPHKWQIDPHGRFKRRWDVLLALLCVYVATFVPYRIGFQIEMCPVELDWLFEVATDVIFALDIVLTFRTPIVTHTGHIERNSIYIRKAYLHSWFIIDLLAVLPISYVSLIVSGSGNGCAGIGNSKLFKVLRLVRLAKMLRLAKLREVVRMMVSDLDALEDSFKYIKIFVAMLAIAYMCHIFACMWFYFGTIGQSAGVSADGGSGQTKEKLRKESGVSGWVDVAGINDASHAVKYLWSVYWAITVLSTVGYGDVVAHTNYEKGFSIVAELFGCIIFATLIGGLGSIMMSKKLLDQKVEYQLEELREFGRVKKLPKSLQKRMRLILEEAYRQTAFDEHKVLAQLPAAMQKEVHEHIYESMLAMMPLFQNLPESESEVLKQLLSAFKPLVVQPFDPVYEEHTPAFDFFVIISGEITLTREGGSTSRVLKKGSFFGERELFYSRRFGAGNQGPLPLVGRKRHQTAIVSSRARAELKFISWPQVMALRRTSRTIFEKIREAAMIRANADEDFKTQEQRRNVLDTLFVQFDAQNFSAKVIQRRWREFSNVRALKKIAVKTDRQLLEMLVQGMSRTEEKLQTVERRLELIEQDRIAGAPRPVT